MDAGDVDAGCSREGDKESKPILRKNRIRVRRRFIHKKRRNKNPTTECDINPHPVDDDEGDEIGEVELVQSTNQDHDYCSATSTSRPSSSLSHTLSVSLPDLTEDSSFTDGSGLFSPTISTPSGTPTSSSSPWPQTSEQDFCSPPPPETPPPQPPHPAPHPEVTKLLLQVREKLLLMLPQCFWPLVDDKGLQVLMVGRRESKAVQRTIFISPSGSVRIEVHGQEYPAHTVLRGTLNQQPLSEVNLGYFVDRIVQIVKNVRIMEMCAGMDKQQYKDVWSVTPVGVMELDIYKEFRYQETFRSKKCTLLVEGKNWRCMECTKLLPFLKRKLQASKQEEPHLNTNTRYLLDKQKNIRLTRKQKIIKKKSLMIDRLQTRMQQLIAQEGFKVEKNLSDDLTEVLQSANLSVTHSIFLQQQLKAIKCKKSCGMRWHPTLIRFALSIYLKSPSAYKELVDTGFVKLPTARTLFDYSHATRIEQGIDTTVLESIAKQVEELGSNHKQYHVLMADEIHISKNLVVQKSTGEIIGFTNLHDLDNELKVLDSYFDDPHKVLEPEMATKILAFLVRGVSSKVKDVIASYPVSNPSSRQMYMWTWDVIGALERSGIPVIAFTCDGAPSNRAFIKLHKPATETSSGVIFDTINKYAPDRNLHFFSDVPHLLKTIRNALFNSRLNKKGTRCLKKNGEPMTWDTIIRLYLSNKDKTFKKSYKLTAQATYPDSYSRMKVGLAAVVLSKTVANHIRGKQWPKTSELVEFILKTNNWFDLLNGAFSSHGKVTNNPRLDPYTTKDLEEFEEKSPSSRFREILDYVEYLDEWREDVAARKQRGANMSIMSELGVEPLDGEQSFHAIDESQHEDFEDDSKCLLPHQTQLGIEMSTKAFIGAVSFLIKNGVAFVNARVFCQDPLEQNFGKQRMGGGGSTNPNVSQYYFKQRAIFTVGQLAAVKRSSGNTECMEESTEITSAPLPKKKSKWK